MATLKYKWAEMTMIGPFKKAPEPAPGQPRKPEMEGVERIESRDGTGGKTGHVVYNVASPAGAVAVMEGDLLVKDADGKVHVLTVDKERGGWVDRSNNIGPYLEVAPPAPAKEASKKA